MKEIKMYKLVCKYCNNEFESKNKIRKFCCQSHAVKHQMSDKEMVKTIIEKTRQTKSGKIYIRSEESRNAMSEKMKGRNITWGDKISESLTGKPHPHNRPNFKHTQETKDLLRQKAINQMSDPEMIKLISIKTSEGQAGRKCKEETKIKIGNKNRINHLNRIRDKLSNGDQLSPNYNIDACEYFNKFDEKNNTNGKHAMNGGEFYIKEYGYWVDYINHDLKLIMEWDEKYHFTVYGELRDKDKIRQKQIEELYPDYEFRRIKE